MTKLLAAAWRRRPMTALVAVLSVSSSMMVPQASAATLAPPLLDITHQCETLARRNMRAMSECVVAESEARAEILQKWARLSDAAVDQCVKLGRKAKKYPYSTMAKCLSIEPADVRTTSAAPAAK